MPQDGGTLGRADGGRAAFGPTGVAIDTDGGAAAGAFVAVG